MQVFPAGPLNMLTSGWAHRRLIAQMAIREVVGRYRGSLFGLAWSFFNPLLMLVVYTFVFSVVFRARWGLPEAESQGDYAIILFAGLIMHGLLAECLNRAPMLITGQVNFVKKVVFPLEILPWVMLAAALFHALISLSILLVAQLVLNQTLPWTVVFLPLVMLPLLLGTLGLCWGLASLGVYLRDIGQVTTILTTVLLFVSAVFFPLSALPPRYRDLLALNPLAGVIDQTREVLIFGHPPAWGQWTILLLTGAVLAWLGFAFFQKTRRGFADVL